MNKQEKLANLRRSLTQAGLPPDRPPMSLGVVGADEALGGGLLPGALHEVHAGDWGAAGFAACLAIRMAARPWSGRGANPPIFPVCSCYVPV